MCVRLDRSAVHRSPQKYSFHEHFNECNTYLPNLPPANVVLNSVVSVRMGLPGAIKEEIAKQLSGSFFKMVHHTAKILL